LSQGFLSALAGAHKIPLALRAVEVQCQTTATTKAEIKITAAMTPLRFFDNMLTHSQAFISGPDLRQ
jgi:hypothetical protein